MDDIAAEADQSDSSTPITAAIPSPASWPPATSVACPTMIAAACSGRIAPSVSICAETTAGSATSPAIAITAPIPGKIASST